MGLARSEVSMRLFSQKVPRHIIVTSLVSIPRQAHFEELRNSDNDKYLENHRNIYECFGTSKYVDGLSNGRRPWRITDGSGELFAAVNQSMAAPESEALAYAKQYCGKHLLLPSPHDEDKDLLNTFLF